MTELKRNKVFVRVYENGQTISLDPTETVPDSPLSWEVEETEDRFRLILHAKEEVNLATAGVKFTFDFHRNDRLFLNGYQSWTDSREWTVNGKMRGLDRLPRLIVRRYALTGYGDYGFAEYGKVGRLHGFSYAYIRRGDTFLLLGSLAENSGYTLIRFNTQGGTVSLRKDCDGRKVKGDFVLFDFLVLKGTEDEVFDKWFAAMGIPKPRGGRITGYTSWYNRYQDISQAIIEEDLAGFAGLEKKPDVFQIDDGYESFVGDWLSVDPVKFPRGMKEIASQIREAGMLPGLWLAPFAAEKESALAKEHPDWILRDEDGVPPDAGSNWSGCYGLDIYNEEVRDYLKKVFRTVLDEWGYGLVKLDFLYACCMLPRPDKTRGEIMADGMAFLRELCGDAILLGCGVPLASAFGIADYCRIGCDVSLSWNDAMRMRILHRERPSTRNTILNTVFRRQLNGRAFWNDPDVFLLREENLKLKDREKKILATVNALFGGVLFTSDNVGTYPPETKAFYEKIAALSPAAFRGAELERNTVVIRYEDNGEERKIRIRL
ncbi:MAG: alpha-galactosidase [Clostridia bacterium]|nr:alpha-galactosidase [Clostridia bacterium]